MLICHAHFHRITNGESYTRILNELYARNNPDSKKILQILSEQCEDYDQRVESETEEERISSEEENNADSKNETENPREDKQFWQVQTRAQLIAKQMKRREEDKPQEPQPSTAYAEAASKLKRKTKKKENRQ